MCLPFSFQLISFDVLLSILVSFSMFVVILDNTGTQVVEKTIRPSLVELSEDPDVDVRFFANQALQSIDHVMMSS